ncbi:MAG TPA: SMC-Scp complex subunit ScpB [Clostridia bacterium]|jgi:segregation and condensation protein B|nr:SMC-Scp complex subunit ScpB [Clostridia bacterium]HHY06086.1 SMC-Scp complex subunit ScpB [Clostridia bacterium]
MPTLFPDETKSIIEALLFVTNEPLTVKTMAEIIECPEYNIKVLLKEIKADCERERKGFCLKEVAGGYSFVTRPEYAPYIEKLVKPRLNTLTQAALETLAIIAYRQPVTKSEIDEIRGVNSDSAINTLLGRSLIEEVGRKEGPGRPILYGTTQNFLKYFGLKDLQELPEMI